MESVNEDVGLTALDYLSTEEASTTFKLLVGHKCVGLTMTHSQIAKFVRINKLYGLSVKENE